MNTERIFTREKIDRLLDEAKDHTLGEVDTIGLIDAAYFANPGKVQKGIAGDVIEVSVLGCGGRDSHPEPDITVDGVRTELKTTGVVTPKKLASSEFEAKEPLTITGVSPRTIIGETFDDSRFWHKINHLLFVFYHYHLSVSAKNSLDYKSFPILGHMFWEVPEDDREKLRNDWLAVQKFIRLHSFDDEVERHRLKENLLLMDYASPKQPRFRFKRSYVTTIVEQFLWNRQYEALKTPIGRFTDIDSKCHDFTAQFRGKSLMEISSRIGISVPSGKDSCQRLIVNLFGSEARSINQIRDFQEIGLVAKTIVLQANGRPTEDMKLFQLDFDEFFNPAITFKENPMEEESLFEDAGYSEIYSYFAEKSFIFILFREPRVPRKKEDGKKESIPLSECLFEGFKRYSFKDHFIDTEVFRCWNDARTLVFTGALEEEKNGRGYAPNFPKSSDHIVFFRGSGQKVTDRRLRMKQTWGIDIPMYLQSVWIRGGWIVEELNSVNFL